ncbi:MAG: hypothetical protein D6695_09960 [Planctomycetota bacterium]|nr:MAG: hypothetical protein D6695_09960 [Planctomycetota bacterium]
MKRIGTIISVLAIANVLAFGGFVGWLGQTGRLSMERLAAVREIFRETVAMEKARLEAQAKQEQAEKEAAKAEPSGPARTSSELVAMRLNATDVDMQRIERLRREVEDLQRKLRRDQAMLDERAAEFAQERDAFNAMRERLKQIEGADQFRKSVELLETIKSADAKQMLDELLQQGSQEQVVSYLNAMDGRASSKIIAEFVKDGQSDVAAQLLEALRTRGLEPAGSGEQTE